MAPAKANTLAAPNKLSMHEEKKATPASMRCRERGLCKVRARAIPHTRGEPISKAHWKGHPRAAVAAMQVSKLRDFNTWVPRRLTSKNWDAQ